MMARTTLRSVAVLTILVLFSFVSLTQAEINIKPFEFSGQVTEGMVYNSNPGYASRPNEESCWGMRTGGGGKLELPFGGFHTYSLEGKSDWYKYFTNDKFTHWDNKLQQNLDFSFNRWSLNIHQGWENSEQPAAREMVRGIL